MRAIDGKLKLNQSYTLINVEYGGKNSESDLTSISWQCENCGKGIANIATVKGSVDNKEYKIGLDCAAALTGIVASEIEEAKKRLRKEAKFLRWVKTKCLYYWINEMGSACLFDREMMGTNGEYFNHPVPHGYVYRCNPETYKSILSTIQERRLISRGEYSPFEFSDFKTECFSWENV